ncbi:hypothetical protein [Shewanella sp.]|uniref:hypothetical protein n=1 Tax=unclassified Shewanella TaxID=196818 RepID=UPI003001B94C
MLFVQEMGGFVFHSANKGDMTGALSLTPIGQTVDGIKSGIDALEAGYEEYQKTGDLTSAAVVAGKVGIEAYIERKIKIGKVKSTGVEDIAGPPLIKTRTVTHGPHSGEQAVNIRNADGSGIDIAKHRVKEYRSEPRSRSGRAAVKFDNDIAIDRKREKRAATQEDLKILEQYKG